MSIDELIQRQVETLPPEATCAEAAALMRNQSIGSVVIAKQGKPVGIVTDRDLVVRVLAENQDPEKVLLGDVMSGEPIFLGADRHVDQVISAMRDLAIRRVPVVDAAGRLCGIISMDDLLILLTEQLNDLAQAIRAEVEAP